MSSVFGILQSAIAAEAVAKLAKETRVRTTAPLNGGISKSIKIAVNCNI